MEVTVRRNWQRLLVVVALILLAVVVLVACETVGTPQPTVTPGAATAVPTKDTTPGTPVMGAEYPTLPATQYPYPYP